jgi:hypothetical protein
MVWHRTFGTSSDFPLHSQPSLKYDKLAYER